MSDITLAVGDGMRCTTYAELTERKRYRRRYSTFNSRHSQAKS